MSRIFIFSSIVLVVLASPILAQEMRTDDDSGAPLDGRLLRCPVEIDGDRVVINKANQAVLAIRGTHDQTLPDGSVHRSRWTMNYSTFLTAAQGLQPGAELELPGDGKYFDLRVTGVVLADGSLWGTEGLRLKADCRDRAIAMRVQLREMLDLAEKYPRDSMIELLAHKEPVHPGQVGRVLHMSLRASLYDQANHDLKDDPVEFISRLLAHLDSI